MLVIPSIPLNFLVYNLPFFLSSTTVLRISWAWCGVLLYLSLFLTLSIFLINRALEKKANAEKHIAEFEKAEIQQETRK
jgi:hypothetical protein